MTMFSGIFNIDIGNMFSSINLLSTKFIVIYVFLICTLITHFRGKKRLTMYRQLIDHSAIMSPINCLMYLFSAVPTTPYLNVESIPELSVLRNNWQVIKDEGIKLMENELIASSKNKDDAGFNSFFKRGWKRFYLKWYNTAHPSAIEACPITVNILKDIPNVKAAMFALLPPYSKLGLHRDPYAGSLRYHLGLATPNSDDCFISVDGKKYSWRDGEDILFDETYVHEAYNNTDQSRLILFCDVARPMHTRLGKLLNNFFNNTIMKATGSPNIAGDRTGFINKVYKYVHMMQQVGQDFKKKNRRAYYITKHTIYVLIILLIIFI